MSISTSLLGKTPTDHGTIVEIAFSGQYRPGSVGHEDAAEMLRQAEAIIIRESPDAVLFNLERLDYVWGDSICGLAHTVMDRESKRVTPACLLAQGRTAQALAPLFEKGFVFEIANMSLFSGRENSLIVLRQRLATKAV
jgi:hypothetical protein